MCDVKCYFCEAEIETVDEAIELGWITSFQEPGEEPCKLYEISEPVCPSCIKEHLEMFDEGDDYMVRVTD